MFQLVHQLIMQVATDLLRSALEKVNTKYFRSHSHGTPAGLPWINRAQFGLCAGKPPVMIHEWNIEYLTININK